MYFTWFEYQQPSEKIYNSQDWSMDNGHLTQGDAVVITSFFSFSFQVINLL